MSSETDVANVALRLIGASPITSFTDGSVSANAVDDIYVDVREDLLRSHAWNFATKRAKLARSSTTPTFEFDYAYPLPADWLRTISIHDNDAGHGTVLHRMELINTQLSIIASADAIYCRYVANITDPNKMSADFRRAFSIALARDLSIPLAASNTMQDQLSKQFTKKMAAARSSDAIGAFPELRPRGSWAGARGGRRDDFLSD